MNYVIIGNGVAGTSAARAIRNLDPAGDLAIISDEPYPFYSRIRLIDYLAGDVDEQGLIIYKDGWYEKNNITLLLNTSAASIAPGAKKVVLADGREIGYDRLLVATGSTPFIPPLGGADKKGIFTLKTLDDAKRIRAFSEQVGSAIILGGGVLGIEVANALRKRGKEVSIVEFFPRLLPRQVDAEGAAVLQKKLEALGLRFYLDARAREFSGGAAVERLLLEDGREVRSGMVVVSAGIRCNTALLQGTGVRLGRGAVVNDRMETSVAGIYAAGDLAEHQGVVYGLWPAAERQGELAGINMAGGSERYDGTLPSNILKVAGISLLSAGVIDAEGTRHALTVKDEHKGIYRKLVIEDECVVGCILCGDMEGRKEILDAMRERKRIDTLAETLDRLGLAPHGRPSSASRETAGGKG